MKKTISAVLVAAVAASLLVLPVSAADASWQSDSEMASLLSELDIMVGDDYGDFNFDGLVTRAQMAKIAVASSSVKNTVALGLQFSPFSDVKGSYWGAPYIRTAVSAGIVDGYIDGTFRPEGTVTYEEAVTMMLRVLGYTDEDFGASYPYGQLGTASGLKLTDGVEKNIGEQMSRRDVAKLVCNALDTRSKTTGQDLIAVHDCAFLEDVTIVATEAEDRTLGSDEISTSAGKYRISDSFNEDYIGCRGDMVIKNGKYFVAFSSDTATTSSKYIVYSTLNDAILCYPEGNNTAIKQFKLSDSTTCYKNSTAYTYGAVRGQMEMGDIVRIRYRSDGEVDYISYSEGNLEGPILVSSSAWKNSFNTNAQTKIVRDGKQVSESSIEMNDILYYSKELNMIMVYTKKVTGVYENAIPSTELPQQVVISGVTYDVEGVDAFNALSSSGSVSIGDTITVIFGRDGKRIAGVAGSGTVNTSGVTGFVTNAGKKEFSNSDGTSYTSYYVNVVTSDGTLYTYPTSYDKSSMVNSVAKITIKDGVASVSGPVAESTLIGTVNAKDMTICGKNVADNVKIIDVANDAYSDVPLYVKTYMQRLDGMSISQGQILYYNTNAKGEIDELILANVTGDMYSYGIVTAVTKSGMDVTQNIVTIENNNISYTAERVNSFSVGSPVKFAASGQKAEYVSKLQALNGNVTELTQAYAVVDNTEYKLSDKVQVYRQTGTKYLGISITDAISGDYKYTCYTDKTNSKIGRIRVIVVRDK